MKKLLATLLSAMLICATMVSVLAGCGGEGDKGNVEVTKDEWVTALDSYPLTNYTFEFVTEKSYTNRIRIDGIFDQYGKSDRGGSTIQWEEPSVYGYYVGDHGVSEMLLGLETVIEWSRERYDEFTFQDGVYFCASISLPAETVATSFDAQDVKIEFSDKQISSVSFRWLQERVRCRCYSFGTTKVELPEGTPKASDGLKFSLTDDAKGAIVTGIGSEQNTEYIVIPHYYERKKMIAIGDRAFYNCKAMDRLAIPNTVETIGAHAFEGCDSLNYAMLPKNLTTIGDSAFEGCEALSEIPGTLTLTSIGERAFANCTSLQSFGANGYSETAATIGAWAFSGCASLVDARLPFTLTEIKEGTFLGCSSLDYMYLSSTVVKIGERAFEGCTALARFSCEKGLASIAAQAFAGCQALEEINFNGTVDEWLAIQKESGWDDGTGEYRVICKDGTVAKDGTIEIPDSKS